MHRGIEAENCVEWFHNPRKLDENTDSEDEIITRYYNLYKLCTITTGARMIIFAATSWVSKVREHPGGEHYTYCSHSWLSHLEEQRSGHE